MRTRFFLGVAATVLVVGSAITAACDSDTPAVGVADSGTDSGPPDVITPVDAYKPVDAAHALEVLVKATYSSFPNPAVPPTPGTKKGTFRVALFTTFPPATGQLPDAYAEAAPNAPFPLQLVLKAPKAASYTMFGYLDVGNNNPAGPGPEDVAGAPQDVRANATDPVEASLALFDMPPSDEGGVDGGDGGDAGTSDAADAANDG